MGICLFYIRALYNLYSAHARGAQPEEHKRENEHGGNAINSYTSPYMESQKSGRRAGGHTGHHSLIVFLQRWPLAFLVGIYDFQCR